MKKIIALVGLSTLLLLGTFVATPTTKPVPVTTYMIDPGGGGA